MLKKVGLVSLGCARNLVDSEVILGSLKREGFAVSNGTKSVDICVINTCAFIGPAREESVDTILEAGRLKKEGRIKKLVVCGCLPQAYKKDLVTQLPEVDLFVGTSDFPKIGGLLKKLSGAGGAYAVSETLDYLYDEKSPRFRLLPKHYAYVKISEGCSNFCSYCIISRLRGSFRSRTIRSVVEETRSLSRGGRLKEANLVGQDTTLFGLDIYGKMVLPELLGRLCSLDNGPQWVRILYTHPAHYTDALIDVIRENDKVCKYLDLPIQHISDNILKRMNRRTTKDDLVRLIDRLKDNIPGIALRTSIIVGFPGETEKDFKELLKFLKDTEFDRLGAFLYSEEEGTPASRMKGRIPEEAARERFDELMRLQKSISERRNRRFLGKRVRVLIDEKPESPGGSFFGRTEADAPETDGGVFVSGKRIMVGQFYDVKITDTLEYDLVGEVL
ncbi:MAG: 30S ribosomal protein S12 methylthiotransferase RimO [Candidatus Omnitrophica bacterium]|nr:30S ribosomal protein S12 methylthiotransferase RimO [Candidatus Omnitrophota bacterium]